MGLTGMRVEAILADPDTAAGAAVVAADARPALSAAATISVAATGAGVPVSAATAVSVTAAGVGVPISSAAAVPIAAAGLGVPASATAAIFVAATGAIAPISAAAISAVAVGAPSTADASPAGSSSASLLRSITSPAGEIPGATPCLAGSAAEAKGGAGVGPYPVPDCGTLPLVAAAVASSTVGPAVPPMTPPLTAGGVVAHPAEVDNTRSAFFSASGGTKSRGAAL
uniref:Uncharacterized protein n=1 Tax=Setaria viridis TaxID=4556 RepID=A0A4U6VLQ1_SETVI|nr:hypothetical protein SEVIR_3G337000v2 [Setaria viridis]